MFERMFDRNATTAVCFAAAVGFEARRAGACPMISGTTTKTTTG